MTRRKKTLPYREGTWFAVPLRTNGYAVGVVSRMDGRGAVFGYFFGPKLAGIPRQDEVGLLSANDAKWSCLFGDLGLLQSEWSIIFHAADWDRASWPLPPFVNVDRTTGKAVKVILNDDLTFASQAPCEPSLAERYPEDGAFGYGAVEIRLTDLLDKTSAKKTRRNRRSGSA
jgi:hypothetical protein